MSAHGHHPPEIDPVTGHETTGHDWNGIRELNTPFPRIVIWALAIAFAYSVVAWVLLPAWPTGRSFTRGVLGLEQGQVAMQGFERLAQSRGVWMARFDKTDDLEAAAGDKALLATAMPAARRLFEDNCAACHGTHGTGGPGFPDLADSDWLWGGTLADIAETIRVGINSTNPDSRVSQMMAFGRDGILERKVVTELADFVVALPTGKADLHSPGAEAFAENCASCHGEEGKGGLGTGAPALALDHRIYGGDHATVLASIWGGRHGVMPSWAGRLSEAEINLLAVFVHRLATDRRETVAR